MALQELPKPTISRREREVAALVAEGLTNREIGQRLFVSERTVDAHLEHIREKLGVSSRAQVAAWFVTQSQSAQIVTAVPVAAGRPARRWRLAAALASLLVILVVGVVAFARQQQPPAPIGPIITTIAGSSGGNSVLGGSTGDYGPALLGNPFDVAVAPSGDLYIADFDNAVIRRVDHQDRTIATLAGGVSTPFVDGGYGPSTGIGNVTSLAISADGDLYFANGTFVARIDADLTVHLVSTGPLVSPAYIRFAPDGSLYISDTFADRVWRRAPDGSLTVYAGDGTHGFSGDEGAATGAELSYPMGLAVDTRGDLYIADAGNDRVRRVDAGSHVITTIAGSADTYGYGGDGGRATKALLSLPTAVAIDSAGDVYIADPGNDRVRRVDATTQVITTIVGSGQSGFGGDGGPAVAAALLGPFGIALDGQGNLYIADTGNHRIRLVMIGTHT
jgi:trimeric autotransporter adhesin